MTTHSLAVRRLLCAVLLSVAVSSAAQPKPSARSPDANTLEAIRNCRKQIAELQLPNGAFRMSPTGDGRPFRIIPYFGNTAARALLVAHVSEPDEQDWQRAARWIDWYAAHARPDGTILDFVGTDQTYAASPKRDSIDTYPPSYLATLWWFWKTRSPEQPPVREQLLQRAVLALDAIERSIDPADGLAWSSVPHQVKYPMDNLEVCIGLAEGERLLMALGATKEAARARRLRERCQEAVKQFWLPDKGYFAWGKGTSRMSISFEKPYPDGVVNLFAASCIEPSPEGLWANLQRQFGTSERLAPEMWLSAAHRGGLKAEIERYRNVCLAAAREENLTLERAARLLIALAGEEIAAPVIIPLDLGAKEKPPVKAQPAPKPAPTTPSARCAPPTDRAVLVKALLAGYGRGPSEADRVDPAVELVREDD
jgi:hypothetical protein